MNKTPPLAFRRFCATEDQPYRGDCPKIIYAGDSARGSLVSLAAGDVPSARVARPAFFKRLFTVLVG